MIKIWKGKSIDLFLVLIYFILYSLGIHVIVAIKHSIKYHKDIMNSIQDPLNFLLTFGFLFIFMSPVWVYYRKVPNMLKIDPINQKLEIHTKRKTLKYDMDHIRFFKRTTTFFCILEIHATFESPRYGKFERLGVSIIVPNWGLSWNKCTMDEITNEFKNLNIKEINDRPHIPISDYFYN